MTSLSTPSEWKPGDILEALGGEASIFMRGMRVELVNIYDHLPGRWVPVGSGNVTYVDVRHGTTAVHGVSPKEFRWFERPGGLTAGEAPTEASRYPDNNPKSVYGVRKASLHLIPPVAAVEESKAFALGAEKYGPFNWRSNSVAASVYYAAALRHLAAWWDGEDRDPESKALHLAHARACMGILIDAAAMGNLIDDRPPAGPAPAELQKVTPQT